ncbi:ATP-binding protein [Ramlibacter tataouinensis]|uniref:hybrid sensor histidine kinase/response regulator n=1 Tax=Ramlibacter tataouinensis TaxID=94132 RepID=UPI0022F3AA7F|nr:ATP-binding protein [Ramlibacter tataouinensis]WBY01105.1 ATP-binding protein [Ramlibacter tataouinensis]
MGKLPTQQQEVALLAANLQASEERLQLAVDAGGLGVWQVDLESGLHTWWPGMERLHGLPAGSQPLHGEAYFEAIDARDRDRVRAAIREAIVRTGWSRVEYRVRWPDGRVRWIEARGRVRRGDNGRALSMSGVCVDITRRKHVEHDLKFLAEASAELAGVNDYAATLDRIARLAVPRFADWCAVDMLQPDGSLRRVATAHLDPARERVLHEMHEHHPPDPQVRVGTWHVLRTGRGDLVPEISEEMLEAGAGDDQLREMLRQLGMRSYIGAPLNTRGRTLGVLTFVTTRSGRRYGPEDLALAEDLARRAAVAIDNAQLLAAMRESDRAKDVFLATLAHELRNPLAPIWNGLSLIKRARGDPHRIEHVGGIIERQVGQLSRLVDDLLDVSRISAGKIELKKETTNLVHVINAAVEVSRPHIEAAHHQLSIAFPNAPTDLQADPARLTQVFSNLLNNAAKYTRRGGRIDVTVEALPEQLVVRVRDSGIGIASEMLDKVFGLFTQAGHPTERHQGGLGIGLSLVEGLVRLHGGQVEAHSGGLGKGSEFVVVLPRHGREPAPADPAGGAADAPVAAQPVARRMLVVDDNEDAASTVAELLRMSGSEVAVAHDGLSAVDRTAEFRPDVVLLDIGLPDISGYEVARRIRKLEGVRQPMLIALTGWGQQQDKEAAAQAGFDQHWTKPVDPLRLQELSGR